MKNPLTLIKWKLVNMISDAVIADNTKKAQEEMKRMIAQKDREMENAAKTEERRRFHSDQERSDSIHKLQAEHKKEISRLSTKIMLLERQHNAEREKWKRERSEYFRAERHFDSSIAAFSILASRLDNWLNSSIGEPVRINGDLKKALAKAEEEASSNALFLRESITTKPSRKTIDTTNQE